MCGEIAMKKKLPGMMKLGISKTPVTVSIPTALFNDVRALIEEARSAVAVAVNTGTALLYWRIGKRIKAEILKDARAKYGEEIVVTLSRQLVAHYGRGFAEKNLRRMMQFYGAFKDEKIVVTLSRQLTWSHFVALLPLERQLERDFYAEMCRIERWDVRTLRAKIAGMLFERTAVSRKPEKLVDRELAKLRAEDRLTPDLVFKDPYFLDFLGLTGTFQEKDIEAAILREMESFIMELGGGFSFMARQKRITVDGEDFYLDLLFYHRDLKRLVAIELKLDKFKPEYKGQMELYLRWLDKYERKPGEEPPLGLILCAGKSDEQIELLELNKSGIRVAQYMARLLPRKMLEQKLHDAIHHARSRIEAQEGLQ
jgi:predicted nuclease of restriction endonuclease-like (RecB) superfamily